MPIGKFTIYAGRGFEFSVAQVGIELATGERKSIELTIRHEVDTAGYAAVDTHCHTFTFSRHGDATIEERMITIAGEGIEVPVATDHNLQVDYEAPASSLGVRRYFTPITGNEVTTEFGHFNVFPLRAGPTEIDHKGRDWKSIFMAIGVDQPQRLVVFNHARDIHNGFRPFDPQHHIGIAGERLDGQTLRANLMEVINSGTTQTDGLQLLHDWFGLMNRGLKITPVGSSDSHDVARHFVGMGRTYVRCDDRDPAAIATDEVGRSLAEGRVMVSFGLLAELKTVDGKGPGDLVGADDAIKVTMRVLGPQWTKANRIKLYSNGVEIYDQRIDSQADDLPPGVKWRGDRIASRPKHDCFLSMIATGPGIRELYWPTPKPYQPTSTAWTSYVLGASGALLVDADGDGRFTSANEYATRLVKQSGGELPALVAALADYDEAVAVQAASILAAAGRSPLDDDLATALKAGETHVRRGFSHYADAWKRSQEARANR